MTKGQLESKISEAISKFEIEYMGRGPKNIRTHFIGDMIITRMTGVLSSADQKLIDAPNGIELFKKVRSTVFEGGRGYLETVIKEVIPVAIISTHSDISTKTGEKLIVITIEGTMEDYITK